MWYHQAQYQILIIISVAFIAGLVYNAASPRGLPLLYQPPLLSTEQKLSVHQAYLIYREGKAIFIDTRTPDEFKNGHIKNAINIPYEFTRGAQLEILNSLQKIDHYIVYCISDQCDSAQRMAGFMKYIGFSNVSIFTAGYRVWVEHGMPVSRGGSL